MKEVYDSLGEVTKNKPIALGEIGTIPDVTTMEADRAEWLWFMTWSKDFVLTENWTTKEVFAAQYNHPYAITLEKLPKLY